MKKQNKVEYSAADKMEFSKLKFQALNNLIECNSQIVEAIQKIDFIKVENCVFNNIKGTGLSINMDDE